jgi:small-conductance mechanosensitive channel
MNLFDEAWERWVLVLAVGLPLLMILLTEVLGALTRRENAFARPLRLLRNWLLPTGAILALAAFAATWTGDGSWVRVIATIFGFLVILLILSAFNVALFANAQAGSWRERIPSIFVEIARLILVAVGLAVLFSWVWDADIGGLIAALGVTSIIIGLALQNAVGGVISGLLLLFEQPFKIGDWLDTGSVRGRVVEVNWRAVHIDTGSGLQVLPNSMLAAASFTNKSRPTGPFYAQASMKFSTDDPPQEVTALLLEVAARLPMRLADSEAEVGYLGSASYVVSIPLASPAEEARAISIFQSWLWYAARRRRLALDGDSTDPLATPEELDEAVARVSASLHLRTEDTDQIRSRAHLERFGAGEVILPSGALPDEVLIIVDGQVALSVEAGGGSLQFAVAGPGEFVGQSALTRQRTQTTARSVGGVTVLSVPLETVDALVATRPRLAAEISESVDLKRDQAARAVATAGVARGVLEVR